MRHRWGVEAALTVEDVYRKWSDDLVRYATALVGPADAADLVADTFATLLARGDDAWQQVREPRAYVFRSVTNAARMLARGRGRRERREQGWRGTAVQGEFLADPAILAALGSLSVRQRAAVFLTYWEDLTPAAVAERLGVSEGSVRRHLARGRDHLREVLA